jgi:predicted site-specific integrase-resolvase
VVESAQVPDDVVADVVEVLGGGWARLDGRRSASPVVDQNLNAATNLARSYPRYG